MKPFLNLAQFKDKPLFLKNGNNNIKFNRRLCRIFRFGYLLCRFLNFDPYPKRGPLTIVSDKYRFIYIGTPLAGTRTLLSVFSSRENSYLECYREKQIVHHLLQERPFLSDYFIFSFVRNPLSRVISCYNKKILNANTVGKLAMISQYKGLNPQMTLSQFIDWLCGEEGSDEKADPHWMSQCKVISHTKQNSLFDFIGKLEKFQTDFNYICSQIGIKSIFLPCIASSDDMPVKPEKTGYKDSYHGVSMQHISQRYNKDMEIFGY